MYSIHTFLLQKELFRSPEPVKTTVVSSFTDTPALQQIARQADSDYILFYTGTSPIELHPYAIGRMYQIAESNDGALFYSDYQEIRQGKKIHHPTLEYQTGSIRNDFDFGQLLLFRNDSFQQVVAQMNTDYRFAALYELRLSISRLGKIVHIPETLYTVQPTDLRLSGEKQFDYVDPANREVQLEMEAVCTAHLQAIGAWLAPEFQRIDFGQENFAREASVIIPVRNRKRTIAEAVESALQQQTDFSFNVIVVDNHSTDGTGQILTELSRRYPNLIHHIPASTELGIGGCWTEAILLPECGKFAIQLDSDDLYKDCHVLQRIVGLCEPDLRDEERFDFPVVVQQLFLIVGQFHRDSREGRLHQGLCVDQSGGRQYFAPQCFGFGRYDRGLVHRLHGIYQDDDRPARRGQLRDRRCDHRRCSPEGRHVRAGELRDGQLCARFRKQLAGSDRQSLYRRCR